MKKKLNLISLSKEKLSEKQKAKVLGGEAQPGLLGCCCGGHGHTNTWGGVRRNNHDHIPS